MTTGAIDWQTIALWAGGVATVLASVVTAIVLAVDRVRKIAASIPFGGQVTRQDTRIITTDTVAMQQLAVALGAVEVTLRELNQLLTSEIAARARDKEVQRLLSEQQLRERLEDLETERRRTEP